MSENVFEESVLKLKVGVTAGSVVDGKGDYVFLKNGSEIERKPGTLTKAQEFTLDYPTAKVDDDKDNYLLQYYVDAELKTAHGTTFKKKTKVLDTVVWPQKIKLKALEDASGANAAGFKFKIKQDGANDHDDKTAADGTVEVDLQKPAAYTIEAIPPWEIKSWTKDKGRNREVKVIRHFTAKILNPVAIAPIKQWVNLDTTQDGRDAKGSVVKIEVGVSEDVGKAEDDRIGRADDPIFIEVNFSRASKRNLPKPELKDADAIAEADAGKKFTGQVKLGPKGASKTFTVELGLAGGDTCTVKVGSTNACADHSITFANWRKLYYELMYPDFMTASLEEINLPDGSKVYDIPQAIKASIDAKLAPTHLVYERLLSLVFPAASAHAATRYPGAYLKQPGRERLVLGSELAKAAHDPVAFTAPHEPRCVHIRMCDRISKFDGDFAAKTSPDLTAVATNIALGTKAYYLTSPDDASAGVDVTGCDWTAKVDPAACMKDVALVIANPLAPDTAGAAEGTVTLTETVQNISTDLLFPKPLLSHFATDLDAGLETLLDQFVQNILADTAAVRRNGLRVNVRIKSLTGNDRRTRRVANVVAALNARFTPGAQQIADHPGLDDAGTPRTGAVALAWLSFADVNTVRITLPTRANPADPIEPGDFVGALGANTCPISVEYQVRPHKGVNGSSSRGKGRHTMNLRPGADAGAVATTFCHELGHNMGMTIMDGRSKIPPGCDPALHVDNGGVYYLNGTPVGGGLRNCHQGPHCATGVGNIAAPAYSGANVGTCILFGSGGDVDTRPNFCPVCTGYIQARKLTDIVKLWTDAERPNAVDF